VCVCVCMVCMHIYIYIAYIAYIYIYVYIYIYIYKHTHTHTHTHTHIVCICAHDTTAGAESFNDRTHIDSGTLREKTFLRRRRHAPSGARAASARLKKNFEAGTLWDELHVSLSPPGAMLWGAHDLKVVTAAGEGVTGGGVLYQELSARMVPCQRHISLEISRRRRQRPGSAPVARAGNLSKVGI